MAWVFWESHHWARDSLLHNGEPWASTEEQPGTGRATENCRTVDFLTAHSEQASMEPRKCGFGFCQWFGILRFFWCSVRCRWDSLENGSSHHHGRGENSVPGSLEPAQQAAMSWAAAPRGCGDGRAQGWLPAAAPVPCSRSRSIPAAFTQLLMIPASSLRTSVTDGGSAGLCPLGKAEQYQLLDSVTGQCIFASCAGRVCDFKDRLTGLCFTFIP